MTPNFNATNNLNPLQPWISLGMKLMQMMWDSSYMVTDRTRALLPARPDSSAEDTRVPVVAGQEKIQAAYASAIAMSAHIGRMNIEFGTLAFKQWMATATSLTAFVLRKPPVVQLADLDHEKASVSNEIPTTVARVEKPRLQPLAMRATKHTKRLSKAKPSRNGKHMRRAKRVER